MCRINFDHNNDDIIILKHAVMVNGNSSVVMVMGIYFWCLELILK